VPVRSTCSRRRWSWARRGCGVAARTVVIAGASPARLSQRNPQ
jgi:hypothetical protein